ncbi:MAG TPA: metal-dependent hydrolase [Methanoregulaceae archaeon]|nr:metal-dependent hydrolase [Methanoregulaceae archaeon]
MDALSHALIAYILFSAPLFSSLIPFAILGAVIPDADILFSRISDSHPSLYLFTHGGITHSIPGAVVLSLLTYSALLLLDIFGGIPEGVLAGAGASGFIAILAGALLHLAIDLPAMPGIPLIAPFSDHKYTLGILPGPSLLLAVAAAGVAVATLLRFASFASALTLYAGIVIAYFGVRTAVFLYADVRLKGRKVPKINPLEWLVIRKDEDCYLVSTYSLLKGNRPETVFPRYRETAFSEVDSSTQHSEVRRFLFHSYSVSAERIGSVLILTDPVREKGYVWYPPKFKRVAIPARAGQPENGTSVR